MQPPSIKHAACSMQHAAWHTAMERLLPAASSPSELRLPVTAPCPAALFTLHDRCVLRRSAAEPRGLRIDRTAVLTAAVQCAGPVCLICACSRAGDRKDERAIDEPVKPQAEPRHENRPGQSTHPLPLFALLI